MTRPLPRAQVPAAVLARATALARGVTLGPDSPLLAARPPRAPRRDDEHREQAALFAWAKRNEDRIQALRWLFAVPNGGARSKAAAGRMKAEGVKRGVLDVWLPVARRDGYRIVFLGCVGELKTETGRATPEQVEWIAHLAAEGWSTHLWRSAAQARAALCAYLGVTDPESP